MPRGPRSCLAPEQHLLAKAEGPGKGRRHGPISEAEFCPLGSVGISSPGQFQGALHLAGFASGSVVKNLLANAGEAGLIPGLGRMPGKGNGNPLQCSCFGESHGQGSLVGYSPRDLRELAKQLRFAGGHRGRGAGCFRAHCSHVASLSAAPLL